jgi:hypothetical protein
MPSGKKNVFGGGEGKPHTCLFHQVMTDDGLHWISLSVTLSAHKCIITAPFSLVYPVTGAVMLMPLVVKSNW